jgi:Ser/Thr protein kinase RdoA (MazF antagonist)
MVSPKTRLSKSDLEKILLAYDFGELVNSESMGMGRVQTNILLRTTKGKFVLRHYENRSMNSVLFEVNLIKYLKDRNYPCPAILKAKNGRYARFHNEKPCVILEFVEGKHIQNPNETQKKQLIKKVAELHNLTRNYLPSYRAYRWNYNVALCNQLAQSEAEKINTENSRQKLRWLKNESSRLNLPESLPKGVCHCDFHFSNVLFENGKFNALIDFDDANYTYLLFDLAGLADPFVPSFEWNTWRKFKLKDNVFDFRRARKVISEYMRHRSLNNNEKRHLFDVYKLGILLDCVWYFKRGKADDFFEKRKIDYLNNLGREEFYSRIFG